MKHIPVRHMHSDQKEPHLLESFSIRDIGTLLGGKNMVQELHRHDYFYVLVLQKGAGFHEIDFVPYKICDNSVFFMRPGHVHQLSLEAGSQGFLLQFKADFYYPNDKTSAQLLRKASHKNFCRIEAGIFNRLSGQLQAIFKEYTGRLEGYQEVIKANLSIFFIELVRGRQYQQGSPQETNSYTEERFDEFAALLETHIATHKQVSQYAEMLHLSVYQLNAITKNTVGKTCSELITEAIILESKRYLLATSNQVNQIAWHLGYEDVSYYIRFFKKHTGHSPEAFRHNFK
ncbi:AraC family transcriptional regulator [Flavobacterium humi]|uniref:Helix-turn-helix domain-containing protein n=1 Tax=Flavobacterium humi TaxID=2562683 RepID=A0A4Z0L8Q8_9FLAO|nr:AraC family transcriptional regulator [Flavobacterium humi]TGD58174.1 helix-turn-helix domain-containing protein [Flavobacterium humi]